MYLDRESHARDYRQHLAMFATRAHLAYQHQFMSKRQLNALMLKVGLVGSDGRSIQMASVACTAKIAVQMQLYP